MSDAGNNVGHILPDAVAPETSCGDPGAAKNHCNRGIIKFSAGLGQNHLNPAGSYFGQREGTDWVGTMDFLLSGLMIMLVSHLCFNLFGDGKEVWIPIHESKSGKESVT